MNEEAFCLFSGEKGRKRRKFFRSLSFTEKMERIFGEKKFLKISSSFAQIFTLTLKASNEMFHLTLLTGLSFTLKYYTYSV